MITTDWANCYDLNWNNVIVSEAMAHPAKFSHGLVRRIYSHLRAEYGLEPGGVVVDPFGGVALGALYAMKGGLSFVGCELEEKFVELGRANIDKWNREFAPHFPGWGSAVLLQGDSRRLAEVIGAAGAVVGSPPYSSGQVQDRNGIDASKFEKYGPNSQAVKMQAYGHTPGNLGNLPPGSLPAVVSSPPWAGNSGGRGEASRNGIDPALFDRHQGAMVGGIGGPGNLAGLEPGDVAAVVSSPPYASSVNGGVSGIDWDKANENRKDRPRKSTKTPLKGEFCYGQTPGQLGAESSETFWQAARAILDQCALILPPGAPAVWVVKSFVKGGKLVPFPDQWRQLCEASGFETVEWVRAWQVKNQHEVITLEGDRIEKSTRRASFFRLLAEKKGSPVIDHEVVLFTKRVLR